MAGRRGRRPDPPQLRKWGFSNRQTEYRFWQLIQYVRNESTLNGGNLAAPFEFSVPDAGCRIWGLGVSKARDTMGELQGLDLVRVIRGFNQNTVTAGKHEYGEHLLYEAEAFLEQYSPTGGMGVGVEDGADEGDREELALGNQIPFGYWQVDCPKHGEVWTPTGNCAACIREGLGEEGWLDADAFSKARSILADALKG